MRQDTTPTDDDRKNGRRLRIARRVILGSMLVLVLFVLLLPTMDVVIAGGENGIALWRPVVSQAAAISLSVLLVVLLRGRLDGRREPDRRIYWASIILAVVGAAAVQMPLYSMFFLASWWAIGIFVTPRGLGVVVTLGLLVTPWVLFLLDPMAVHPLAHLLMWAVSSLWALLLATGSLTSIWLWDITNEAVHGQAARARLAVTEERLRFARDMHDLLGHSLSALAVKAELASRLAERAPERAAVEMGEVHELARKALQQVRTAVSGYREVDLADEVAAVSAVLSANGTRVSVTGLDGLEPSPRQASLAAWVVREGATNVLRHSDAHECQIAFVPTRGADVDRALVVEVANDRAHGRGNGEEPSGHGLAGLSERVVMAGGTLSASRTKDNGFLLRAVIPL